MEMRKVLAICRADAADSFASAHGVAEFYFAIIEMRIERLVDLSIPLQTVSNDNDLAPPSFQVFAEYHLAACCGIDRLPGVCVLASYAIEIDAAVVASSFFVELTESLRIIHECSCRRPDRRLKTIC